MEDRAFALVRTTGHDEVIRPMSSGDPSAPRADITRKDFLNASLLGAGAALLHAVAPAEAMRAAIDAEAPKPDAWTGPGGTGDYASSNGNTKSVVDAAHAAADSHPGKHLCGYEIHVV